MSRGLGSLLRAAARAAAAQPSFGHVALGEACCSCSGQAGAGQQPLRGALTQLHGLGAPYAVQQRAGFAAHRHRPGDSDGGEKGEPGAYRHDRHSHTELRHLAEASVGRAEEEEGQEEGGGGAAAKDERAERIRSLLAGVAGAREGEPAGPATDFVSSFFGGDPRSLDYKGEDFAYSQRPDATAAEAGDADWIREEGQDAEDADGRGAMEISRPAALDDKEQFDLLSKLQGLRTGPRRKVLQKLLQGGMLEADPQAKKEWQEIQQSFKPPEGFRMKVVDVNRTCKGTRSGGLYRYSCMVVVGNGEGVLGWGQGKAAEVNDAVQKAYHRACKNLYPVPRYNEHTIPEPMEAKFGQVKIVMYPKSSGRGIVANDLVFDICKMAGIHDIGVKVHGSRNPRNAVKCLFEAFDKLRTPADILQQPGKLVAELPVGRYGHSALLSQLRWAQAVKDKQQQKQRRNRR